jgi:hypothetical protein
MNAMSEPMTAAYLARRGVAAQWRSFLRALVETLDEHLDAEGRASLMRAVGTRMAELMPLPRCDSLAELEGRINDALAMAEWGYAELTVHTGTRRMVIRHHAAPVIATGNDPDGRWLGAVLEGVYGAWLKNQPGADPGLRPTISAFAPGAATLEYGRSE